MLNLICGNTERIEKTESCRLSIGLIPLRLVAGLALMAHGFGKIQQPFGWMGEEAPIPGLLQALAALSEFGGGLALILGLLTSLSSLGILITMLVGAAFHISRGDGFVGGWELATVYATIALFMIFVGPGRYSLDAVILSKFCRSKSGSK